MAALPECFECGTYIVSGPCLCSRCKTEMDSGLAALTEKLETLQNVCAEAYQLAGMCGAPEKALDNLCAAAQGEPIPHESFLPVYEKDLELGKKLEAWRDFYAIHCTHVPFLNYGNTFDKLRELGEVE